eukprot:1271759-Rhodomonas_salina.3
MLLLPRSISNTCSFTCVPAFPTSVPDIAYYARRTVGEMLPAASARSSSRPGSSIQHISTRPRVADSRGRVGRSGAYLISDVVVGHADLTHGPGTSR